MSCTGAFISVGTIPAVELDIPVWHKPVIITFRKIDQAWPYTVLSGLMSNFVKGRKTVPENLDLATACQRTVQYLSPDVLICDHTFG